MSVKNEYQNGNKKYATDPEIQFLTKPFLKPFRLTRPIRQRLGLKYKV